MKNDKFELMVGTNTNIEIIDFKSLKGEDKGVSYLYAGHTFDDLYFW